MLTIALSQGCFKFSIFKSCGIVSELIKYLVWYVPQVVLRNYSRALKAKVATPQSLVAIIATIAIEGLVRQPRTMVNRADHPASRDSLQKILRTSTFIKIKL